MDTQMDTHTVSEGESTSEVPRTNGDSESQSTSTSSTTHRHSDDNRSSRNANNKEKNRENKGRHGRHSSRRNETRSSNAHGDKRGRRDRHRQIESSGDYSQSSVTSSSDELSDSTATRQKLNTIPKHEQTLRKLSKEDEKQVNDVESGYKFEEVVEFLIRLAKIYHSVGAPSSHVELFMTEVSSALHITSEWSVTPTWMMVNFHGKAWATRVIKNNSSFGPFAKFFEVQQLIEQIVAGRVSLKQAEQFLDELEKRPNRYGQYVKLPAFAISAAISTVIFYGGGWRDMILSTILGLLVGIIEWVGSMPFAQKRRFDLISEFAEALVCSFGTTIATHYFPEICFNSPLLGAIVWLLPGWTLTLSIHELLSRDINSGTVRLFSALLTGLKLGFAMSVGVAVAFWVTPNLNRTCEKFFPDWSAVFFVPAVVISFGILMDVDHHHFLGCVVTSAVGYSVTYGLGYINLNGNAISVIGAFSVAIFGNMLSRCTHKSSVIFVYCAYLLLVPGSLGVRGAQALLQNDLTLGMQFISQMLSIGLALTIGSMVASILILPRAFMLYN